MNTLRIASVFSIILTFFASFFVAVTPAQAATYPALCSAFTRELEVGDEGEDVKQLQIALKAEGYGQLPETGFYGPLTAEAVRKFQRSRGILSTGNVGPLTFSAMRTAWCGESGGGSGHPVDSNLLFVHVTSGSPYYVYWVSAGMSSCTLDGRTRPTYGIESFSSNPSQTHTVTCTGSQGSLSRSVTYTGTAGPLDGGSPGATLPDWTPQAPTTGTFGTFLQGTFTATQDYINLDVPSSQATLSWNVPNALVCTISGPGQTTHSVSSSGTLIVRPTQTTTYTLSCSSVASPHTSQYIGSATVFVRQSSPGATTGGNGTIFGVPTQTQWDNGQPGTTGSYFRANPTTISNGSASTLSWSTVSGNSCRLSGGSYNNTSVEYSGSVTVSPTVTTTYSLVCVNAFTQIESYRASTAVTVGGALTGPGDTNGNASCSTGDGNAPYPHGTSVGSCTLRQLILRVGSCSQSEQPTYTCTNGRWLSPTGADFCTLYGC